MGEGRGILRGAMADPSTLNALLTKRWAERWEHGGPVVVHPQAFRCMPQGHRLLIVVDPVPETFGRGVKIHLPDSATAGEQMGMGTIMAVGPEACQPGGPYPGTPVAEVPGDLLYKTVITGQYIGAPIRFDYVRDSSYEGSVLSIADRDIWAIYEEDDG